MKSSDWISVEDRLPKMGERVIVCQSFNDGSLFVRMATRVKVSRELLGMMMMGLI